MTWGERIKPRLTTQQKEEILRRYADGETATSLALEFGCTAGWIRHFCPRRLS